jgi:NADPH-dependent 2,4-dienoyl-CoA reductase/sulfur reductase-like enzyme
MQTEAMRADQTACCIVGGGPGGMMLGLLLARQGVEVLVLDKHADFLSDFRGDTSSAGKAATTTWCGQSLSTTQPQRERASAPSSVL